MLVFGIRVLKKGIEFTLTIICKDRFQSFKEIGLVLDITSPDVVRLTSMMGVIRSRMRSIARRSDRDIMVYQPARLLQRA